MAERIPNDDYATPIKTIRSILNYIDFRTNPFFFEPCRGSGNIYLQVPCLNLTKGWCEINPEIADRRDPNFYGADYLKGPMPVVDIIITNPPFSHWREFLTKSLSQADLVVYLLRINYLGSGSKTGRAKFWRQNPPTHIFALEDRPSFTSDGKTDGTDYAWFCWDRANRIKSTNPFNWIAKGE